MVVMFLETLRVKFNRWHLNYGWQVCTVSLQRERHWKMMPISQMDLVWIIDDVFFIWVEVFRLVYFSVSSTVSRCNTPCFSRIYNRSLTRLQFALDSERIYAVKSFNTGGKTSQTENFPQIEIKLWASGLRVNGNLRIEITRIALTTG